MKSFRITVIITVLQLISAAFGISLYGDDFGGLWNRELETGCPATTIQHGCPHLDFDYFYENERINPKFSLDLKDVRWLPNQKLYKVTIRAYTRNGEKIDLKYLWSLKVIGLSTGTHQLYGFNEGVLPEDFDPSDFTTTFLIRGRPDYENCIVWLDYFQLQYEFLDGHTAQYKEDWYNEGFGKPHFDLSVGCHNSNNHGQSQLGLPNYFWPLECGDADCYNPSVTSSLPPVTSSELPPPLSSSTIVPPVTSSELPPPLSSSTIVPPETSSELPPPLSSSTIVPPETSSELPPPLSSTISVTIRTTTDPVFSSFETSSSIPEITSYPPPPVSSISTRSTDTVTATTSSRHIIPPPIYYSSVKPAESESRESFTSKPSPVTSRLIESSSISLQSPATTSQRTQTTLQPVTTIIPVVESGPAGYTSSEISTHAISTFAGIANSVTPAIFGSIFMNLLLFVL
ncbi:uncharacterized protein KNAG_0G02540 [Huiozyma naganishii CBS 8797]|uniref:Flo11 domain-containing protein n=1 Tax=Huiozyma naganishii (strain ATCC MYA-139 / BCRC 22969 / CBS 8797 / KCTC 17520 / NBRC 10181 / NCYC 3082 / Yp74L-3) TaxID=1071383 RepID=J7R8W0_HUIN7|nr:hypothetical protein KNAG_0G02540 [Kazachstania naganishii CBS 8797]CCK71310.1 hypothetical protein KNAG_0G02540 [Kazachstania naganishii CBS 8797]